MNAIARHGSNAASVLVNTWTGSASRRAAAALILAAIALLPLSAAGTLTVGFTLTVSQVLATGAVAVGAPAALRGWLSVPRPLLLAAATLVLVYVAGALFGLDASIPGLEVRSANRDLVYVADTLVGLGILGILADIADPSTLWRGGVAFVIAGLLAALYAVYQWFAQHYGWPLADVNNTLNSDGFSTGHVYQGSGLFGWERVRGTFKEPLYLGSFLVVTLPFFAALLGGATRRHRAALILGTGVVLTALLLSVSTLAWGAGVLALLAVGCIWALSRGRVRASAALATACALAAVAGPVLFVDPSALSTLTGRTSTALRTTTTNRLDAWDRALGSWQSRPVLGYGPGQSAVQLAYRPDTLPDKAEPMVYGSAQGLWAASLIDVGLVGFFSWIALLAALFAFAVQTAFARSDRFILAGTAAAGVAVIIGELSADRFDIRVWLALGLMLAAASHSGRPARQQEDHQAQ